MASDEQIQRESEEKRGQDCPYSLAASTTGTTFCLVGGDFEGI